MRVFVTGATGFIGSAVVKELIAAGHQVLGLRRSDDKARRPGRRRRRGSSRLARGSGQPARRRRRGGWRHPSGLQPRLLEFRGKLRERPARHRGARRRRLPAPTGRSSSLPGPGSPTARPGEPATEDDAAVSSDVIPAPRRKRQRPRSPRTGSTCRSCGCRRFMTRSSRASSPTRSPWRGKKACPPMSATAATAGRRRMSSMWPASTGWRSKRRSRARDITRSPKKASPCSDIAEAIGRRLKLPVKSIAAGRGAAHFGWLAMFAAHDMPASSEQTRKKLGWQPTGPGLIADLERLQVSDG